MENFKISKIKKVSSLNELYLYDIILDYYDSKNERFYDEEYEVYCKDDFEAVKSALDLCKLGIGKCVHIIAFNDNGDIILNIGKKLQKKKGKK